jgi:hypothetical protein
MEATNLVCNVFFCNYFSEKGDASRFGFTDVALFWHNDCAAAGNCVSLPCTFTPYIICKCIEQSLQRSCTSSGMVLEKVGFHSRKVGCWLQPFTIP